jgi:hypothetical protein
LPRMTGCCSCNVCRGYARRRRKWPPECSCASVTWEHELSSIVTQPPYHIYSFPPWRQYLKTRKEFYLKGPCLNRSKAL